MMKLVPVMAAALAFAAMACQPASPAQAPQGGAMGPPSGPPPGPPCGTGPGMMGQHDDCPGGCPFHHGGGDEADHEHGGGERMAGSFEHDHHRMGGWPGRRGREAHGGGRDALSELGALGVHLYPARMLLRRAHDIGLTPDQVTKIRQEMLGMQAHAVDVVAKLQHAKIEAARLLSADKVDEHAVDAQIDEAAKAAADLHKVRLGAILRVRALLTPEQRQKLDEHKHAHEAAKAGSSSWQMPNGDDEDDMADDEMDEEDGEGG